MKADIDEKTARDIMGSSVVGSRELRMIGIMKLAIGNNVLKIPYSVEELNSKKDDYILILGVSKFTDGSSVTIRALKEIFGWNPDEKEPCFYNQDWYEKETFIDVPMDDGWYLIRKNVYEESRGIQPSELSKRFEFPLAIRCVYSFYTVWLTLGMKLWFHDFVWCIDTDHNGDRIYVGKYHDIDGINKNGFSIHRHLALRSCYACID